MIQQIRLSDTQLIVLSDAAQRDDGALIPPARLNGMAARKLAARLLTKKLVREVRTKQDVHVWRRDEKDRAFGLVITAAGRAAIRVEEDEGAAERSESTSAPAADSVRHEPGQGTVTARSASLDPPRQASVSGAPREGSKLASVIGLLAREGGASIEELIAATGWLPHTTRAALTSLRKRGYPVDRSRSESGSSVYRIASLPGQSRAA